VVSWCELMCRSWGQITNVPGFWSVKGFKVTSLTETLMIVSNVPYELNWGRFYEERREGGEKCDVEAVGII
jgi:hypothetical protein